MASEGGVVWSGGAEDLPEPIREFLQNLVGQRIMQGQSHDGTEEVYPSKEQLTLGPGDMVLQAMDTKNSDDSYTVMVFDLVTLVNPEEHAEEFPDWEERLLKGFVLGYWQVPRNDPMLGWFARYKMIKLEQWQFEALLDHNNGQHLEEPCVWLIEKYNDTIAGLAEANSQQETSVPVICGECGRRTVIANTETVRRQKRDVYWYEGATTKDPLGFFVGMSNEDEQDIKMELECLGCGTKTPVPLKNDNDDPDPERYAVYSE